MFYEWCGSRQYTLLVSLPFAKEKADYSLEALLAEPQLCGSKYFVETGNDARPTFRDVPSNDTNSANTHFDFDLSIGVALSRRIQMNILLLAAAV